MFQAKKADKDIQSYNYIKYGIKKEERKEHNRNNHHE